MHTFTNAYLTARFRAVAMLAKLREEKGMSTIEYAFGSLAAAALAGVLYLVVNGNGVTTAIESVITDALNDRPN
ncbi:hypothetical protein A0K93_08860 [Corynebacterium sp. BCW_4722]|nr:hypothetical protein A0K93_08860 [Corynebacterium sp. BCW_4722]